MLAFHKTHQSVRVVLNSAFWFSSCLDMVNLTTLDNFNLLGDSFHGEKTILTPYPTIFTILNNVFIA